MLGQLKGQMTQVVTGLGLTGLADLGIDVPEDAPAAPRARTPRPASSTSTPRSSTKALDADWTKVRDLFAGKGATKGISALLGDYVGTQTGTNGVLTRPDDVRRLGASRTSRPRSPSCNERMKTTEARLKAQFAAMETALNNSQTQQAWLTSQISSLPTLG